MLISIFHCNDMPYLKICMNYKVNCTENVSMAGGLKISLVQQIQALYMLLASPYSNIKCSKTCYQVYLEELMEQHTSASCFGSINIQSFVPFSRQLMAWSASLCNKLFVPPALSQRFDSKSLSYIVPHIIKGGTKISSAIGSGSWETMYEAFSLYVSKKLLMVSRPTPFSPTGVFFFSVLCSSLTSSSPKFSTRNESVHFL